MKMKITSILNNIDENDLDKAFDHKEMNRLEVWTPTPWECEDKKYLIKGFINLRNLYRQANDQRAYITVRIY